ncbi:MAG: hypothetical protein AB1938_11370 [Myxococcota bacterium]
MITTWQDGCVYFTDFNGDGLPDKIEAHEPNGSWWQESDSELGKKGFFDERFERRLDGGFFIDTHYARTSPDSGWVVTSTFSHSTTIE